LDLFDFRFHVGYFTQRILEIRYDFYMRKVLLFTSLSFLIAACSSAANVTSPPEGAPTVEETEILAPTEVEEESAVITSPGQNPRVDDPNNYEFPQLIPFDGIRPVYDPQFSSAADAPLQDDELVLGVAWDGEAKAYPITVLRFREMVNDELAGIPTLVTW
jgi:hypothetical protein